MTSYNNIASNKGKAVLRPGLRIPGPIATPSSDQYRQNLQILHFGGDKIKFGNQELLSYPASNISFRPQDHLKQLLTKEQVCLLDNLWICFNKESKDRKYFLACLNSLSDYFTHNSTHKQNFKFYVVFQGLQPGVYATWLEVIDQIKGIKNPLFKGFNFFQEALDQARFKLGPNFFVTPCLRNYQEPLSYTTGKDQKHKVIFCEHCEIMSRTVKHLNENILALITEKAQMAEKIRKLEIELKQKDNQINYLLANPDSISDLSAGTEVISRPILGGIPKTSPTQTVVGKDFSNPLMAATLPKSGRIAREVADNTSPSPSQTAEGKDKTSPLMVGALPKSIVRMEDEVKKKKVGRILPKTLTIGEKNKGKEKRDKKFDELVNIFLTSFKNKERRDQFLATFKDDESKDQTQIVCESSSRKQIPEKSESISSSSDNINSSPDQSYDGNDVSPMSFDSVALHNLDT